MNSSNLSARARLTQKLALMLTVAVAAAACTNDPAAVTTGAGGTTDVSRTGGMSGGNTGGAGGVATGEDAAPAALVDLVATAERAGSFKTLLAAAQAAELVDTLKSPGPFTVFAPTDAAFAKLPAGTVDTLVKPENKATLQAILKYHVVAGKVLAADVVKLTSAKTVEGRAVTITVDAGKVKVNDANVVMTDVLASNGVIHVIDTVLMPPM